MNATRFEYGSSGDSAYKLIGYIKEGVSDVRLFATHSDETKGNFGIHTGPASNLPLVAALVYDTRRWIVFDGNFQTARRNSNASYVRDILDAAIEDGTVHFGIHKIDFTAGLPADEAASYLREIQTEPLTLETRSKYALMLSASGRV